MNDTPHDTPETAPNEKWKEGLNPKLVKSIDLLIKHPTPRSDKAIQKCSASQSGAPLVVGEFARVLESELAEALCERNAAQAQVVMLREALEGMTVKAKSLGASHPQFASYFFHSDSEWKAAIKALSSLPPEVVTKAHHDAVVAEFNARLEDRTQEEEVVMLREALGEMLDAFDSDTARRYFTASYAGGWTMLEIGACLSGRKALRQHMEPTA